MHVLLPETSSWSAAADAAYLTLAGHTVHRCHDPGELGLACVALRGQRCPLEVQPIDAVVVPAATDPAGRLAGAEASRCARKRRVPIVEGGLATLHDHALPLHAAAATTAACDALRIAGVDPQVTATVSVERRSGGLHATVALHREAGATTVQRVVIAVHDRLRAVDPWAGSIDVAVARAGAAR